LFYRFNDCSESASSIIDVYVDASFKSPQEKELKSRSGCIAFLNRNPLFWVSKRQPLTSQSTEEAEVIAANEGVRALCWLRNIMIESCLLFAKPRVNEDNANDILCITASKVKMIAIHFDVKLGGFGEGIAREAFELYYEGSGDVGFRGVSKNESVKISGKEKESDSITAIRCDDVTRECSGMARFKE